jgi:hypothetical protein
MMDHQQPERSKRKTQEEEMPGKISDKEIARRDEPADKTSDEPKEPEA